MVIVSEETGNISVAYRGSLNTGFGEESLRERIVQLLNTAVLTKDSPDGRFDLRSFVKGGKRS